MRPITSALAHPKTSTVQATWRLPRWHPAYITATLMCAGVLLRLALYLSNTSFWIDEAMLAQNVLHRDWIGLTQPLEYDQGAPLVFLFLSKLSVTMFGGSEFALRLLPLLSSLAALLIFQSVAFRLLNPFAARVAVGLFALSPELMLYAGEFKQYSWDVLIAVSLLWVANIGRRPYKLAMAGAIAVWCSHPATFVLVGVGVSLLFQVDLRTRWRSVLVIGATWLTSFALCYVLFLRTLARNDFLISYWDGAFLSFPTSIDHVIASVKTIYYAFRRPFGVEGEWWMLKGFASVLFLAGCGLMLLRKPRGFVLLSLPFAMTMLAAIMHKYPFAGRLVLFLIPFVCLIIGYATAILARRVGRLHPCATVLFVGVLFVAPIGLQVKEWTHPRREEEMRPLLQQLDQERQPGEKLWVYNRAEPTFRYYRPRHSFSDDQIVIGKPTHDDHELIAAEVAPLRGRMWFIFSHHFDQEESRYLDELSRKGTFIRKVSAPGAVAHLFKLPEE